MGLPRLDWVEGIFDLQGTTVRSLFVLRVQRLADSACAWSEMTAGCRVNP